jgi:5-methylcytosine-specific restriction enzyme B
MELQQIINSIKVWSTWVDSYKKYVPQFIQEAKTKENWQDWDKDVFREYFEQSRDQCVSSLQQGYYTNIEKAAIKKNWNELAALLKKIADQQDQMDLATYDEVKKWFRKYTSQNRKAAANRLIASLQPNLLCTIVNEDSLRALMQRINKLDTTADLKVGWNWFENSNSILNYFKAKVPHNNVYDIMTYPWQTFEILTQKPTANNTNEMSESNATDNLKSLLSYKKQIVLQGPPGTGKTREAKLIAKEFMTLTPEIISKFLSVGDKIDNASGTSDYYTVKSINSNSITLVSNRTTQDWNPPYTEIIEKYNDLDNGIEPVNVNGLHPYSVAIAKHLYKFQFDELFKDQFKLIQFHPSYTYEDFVRGIVAKPNENGEGVLYNTENKILGDFSKKALKNFLLSQKNNSRAQQDKWIEESLNEFKVEIESLIGENGYILSGNITIFKTEVDCFRYGKDWQYPSRINFIDFKELIKAVINGKLDLNANAIPKEISVHAHYRFTYYLSLLRSFFQRYEFNISEEKEPLKNYVLIIDEINRANLSSVLGELIYALEYRGEAVESMYDVEGNKLILPTNLYIIGTMNTADRSVGHIDYAIRRRFAFVDVLPKELNDDPKVKFHRDLFKAVSELFIEQFDPSIDYAKEPYKLKRSNYLSNEFEPKDIWLGHSYFIDKSDEPDGVSMDIRFDYEIKPILLEYVKDGILIGKDINNKIEGLKDYL